MTKEERNDESQRSSEVEDLLQKKGLIKARRIVVN
jgi:hypothetical protein